APSSNLHRPYDLVRAVRFEQFLFFIYIFMKNFFKTTTAVALGAALVLGFQYIPLQEVLPAKAQTTPRMIAGPTKDVFSTAYLTPTSNQENPNLPIYALPRLPLYPPNSGLPLTIDINADGLIDFVYSYVLDGADKRERQYVILNTGNGFELAYICDHQFTYSTNTHVFKGDCANQ